MGHLLGKGPVCDWKLEDPTVSRRHAAFVLDGERLKVSDLRSTNGTFVNGVAVAEAFLVGGETLRVGGSTIVVQTATIPTRPLVTDEAFGVTHGASPAMRRLYPLCHRLAATDVPLIIEGETGTGKEQLAESLHRQGARREGPFVVFDCTAVAASLIESALFGHEEGAFTGARKLHRGVFERAHGGTLLIDEIGDMPLDLQAKLLRVVERGRVTRVGGQDPISVDVRLLVATRRDLDRMVQQGIFRDDLFHRLAVSRIELPPLRDRQGDVARLAKHFWRELEGPTAGPPAALLAQWEDYDWPGNVRELRNAVLRRVALGEVSDSLPPLPSRSEPTSPPSPTHAVAIDRPLAEARQTVIEAFEKAYVARILAVHDGDVARAATAAGVARRHLYRLKAKYGVES